MRLPKGVILLFGLACAALAVDAAAQAWPSKPVKIVVPFTAGSATDILARTFGQKLGELWNQPVIIDNRGGAGGTIGEALVAKSPADGYTLLVHSAAYAYNPSIYTGLSFDTLNDFVEIAALGGQPNVLVVAPATGIKSVADLIAQAKAKRGEFNYASAGIGSGTHINAEKFRLATGIEVVHVPYKGTPEALTDTMTGRVTFYFAPISAAMPHVKEGKLVALAVSTSKRSAVLPAVPTVAESGVANFDYVLWVAMFAPAGTPAAIVERINADVAKVAKMPDVVERMAAQGSEAMPMSVAEFRKFVRDEITDNGRVIKAAGITAQ